MYIAPVSSSSASISLTSATIVLSCDLIAVFFTLFFCGMYRTGPLIVCSPPQLANTSLLDDLAAFSRPSIRSPIKMRGISIPKLSPAIRRIFSPILGFFSLGLGGVGGVIRPGTGCGCGFCSIGWFSTCGFSFCSINKEFKISEKMILVASNNGNNFCKLCDSEKIFSENLKV